MAISLNINGKELSCHSDRQATLLHVLRNELDLKGSRFGCGEEQCGACMVMVDGEPHYACTTQISILEGRKIVTIEGLSSDGELSPLQQAFVDEQAGQCGYCLSGVIISAQSLLDRNPAPSRDEIVEALDRHLCRCGSQPRIIRAVERLARAGT